ncbi:heparan-alpha-glucosaminide N-acetyltransferase domain-containing protein [Geodermatophilus sp. CPCC 206100]|uniref:heparan-alpha-glucosaminide N-acetyltransferase domain-containing protein n=1 Tax=Geodermatophilus sp. CPCC 206100 TaxID=3020054 RepID=UPI003B0095D0
MTVQPDRVVDGAAQPRDRVRRIAGLDVARGLAVLGMFGAHLGSTGELGWSPSTWGAVVEGRSSILFATLAGVSIALLSGGATPVTGAALGRARTRILVRAAWVFAIGGVLELLHTFVAIILGVYAVLFVLALPFLRWPPRWLLPLAGLVAVVGPFVVLEVGQWATAQEEERSAFVFLMVTGWYPALIWWTFVLVGLAIGRMDLRAARVRAGLVAGGAVAAVLGYAGGWLSAQRVAPGTELGGMEMGFPREDEWDPAWFAGAEPHSGTPFELVGSAGVAVAVIGLCLVLADLVPWLVFPVGAVGAMALTVYTAQIVAIWWLDLPFLAGWDDWVRFTITALVLATAWRLWLGRGPLERLLTWTSTRAAGP